MTKEDIEQISNSVLKKLDSQRTIDLETHRKHHEYIDSLIRKEKNRDSRKEQWIRVVGGWGLILILTAIAAAFWNYIKQNINN